MNIDTAYPSRYLKAADLEDGDMVLTIDSVEIETLGQGEDAEDKPVAYFTETDKGVVLNKTNSNSIKGMYGPMTENWIGKKIIIYATEVQVGAEMKPAIRIRLKAAKSGGTLAERYAALVARATALHLVFPALDPAAGDADITAAGIALKAQIEAAEKEPAF